MSLYVIYLIYKLQIINIDFSNELNLKASKQLKDLINLGSFKRLRERTSIKK